jgi:hypothetical protein
MSLWALERRLDDMFLRMFKKYRNNNFSDEGLREMFYSSSGFVFGYEWHKTLHENPKNVKWFNRPELFDQRFIGYCVEICDKPMNDEQFENMLRIQLGEPFYGSCSRDELEHYKKNSKGGRNRCRSQRREQKKAKKQKSKPDDCIIIRDDNIIGAIRYLEREIDKCIVGDPTIIKKLTKIERLTTELDNRRTYNSVYLLNVM